MKKYLVALLVGLTITATIAEAQSQRVSIGQSPTITVKGSYSSNGTATTVATAYSYTVLPLYTSLHTIAGATTDTFFSQVYGDYNSVTFQHDYLKVAGTPTVTVACYVSANGGISYPSTAIATFTLSPTSTTAPLGNINIINSGSGNPYTNYMWVSTGSASSTITSKGYLVPR